jgi:hypothetical protein
MAETKSAMARPTITATKMQGLSNNRYDLFSKCSGKITRVNFL